MKQGAVLLALLIIVGLIVFLAGQRSRRLNESQPVARSEAPDIAPSAFYEAPRTMVPSHAPPAIPAQTPSGLTPGGGLMLSREEAQKKYESSPARATAECQGILKILTAHGYGIEYLEPAYNLARSAHHYGPRALANTTIGGEPYDSNNPAHVGAISRADGVMKQVAREDLKGLLGPLGSPEPEEAILSEIMAFHPTVRY